MDQLCVSQPIDFCFSSIPAGGQGTGQVSQQPTLAACEYFHQVGRSVHPYDGDPLHGFSSLSNSQSVQRSHLNAPEAQLRNPTPAVVISFEENRPAKWASGHVRTTDQKIGD
jgi:hypothetical protein